MIKKIAYTIKQYIYISYKFISDNNIEKAIKGLNEISIIQIKFN